jgi:hypothetical protein
MPMSIVKHCLCHFIRPLVHIYNISLQTGIFPDMMKIAKIRPLFKKGDRQDMQNYKRISILTSFNKILEKLMFKKLLSFLKKHNVLTDAQHVFMDNKSTKTASQTFLESVQEALDRQLHVVGLYLDLSKVYAVINHNILLDKLDSYGIRGSSNFWFKSYLACRTQYVEITHTDSNSTVRRYSSSPLGHFTWSTAGLNFRASFIFGVYK